jgi:hypothetical protein
MFCLSFVERIELATQKHLRRALLDQTWSQDEIAADLRRMSSDVEDAYGMIDTPPLSTIQAYVSEQPVYCAMPDCSVAVGIWKCQ